MSYEKSLCTIIGVISLTHWALASGAELVKLRVNVQAEKHNTVVHFTKGAVASLGGGNEPNGISGVTGDFGAPLPISIILDNNMSEEVYIRLAEFQFRLEGDAKCSVIQKGTSPDFPKVGVSVLAQQCVIGKINH